MEILPTAQKIAAAASDDRLSSPFRAGQDWYIPETWPANPLIGRAVFSDVRNQPPLKTRVAVISVHIDSRRKNHRISPYWNLFLLHRLNLRPLREITQMPSSSGSLKPTPALTTLYGGSPRSSLAITVRTTAVSCSEMVKLSLAAMGKSPAKLLTLERKPQEAANNHGQIFITFSCHRYSAVLPGQCPSRPALYWWS